ncbi:MAG: response regulator [Geminicoccaceae bacterium]
MRALIVDDSLVARKFAVTILKELDPSIECVIAKEAEAGFANFQSEKPEIALIDFNMPGDDGLQLCRKIRDTGSEIRIALCTANTQKAVADRAGAMGVIVINKPLSAEKLGDFVRGADG